MAATPTEPDPGAFSFRKSLVDEGIADELVRVLVGLGETPDAQTTPFDYLKNNFGQGTRPPLTKPNGGPSVQTSYEIVTENKRLKERYAELKASLKQVRDELKATLPEGTLCISGLRAFGVPDVDAKGGISDPFVRVSLLDVPLSSLDDLDADELEALELGRAMEPIAFAAFMQKHGLSARTSTIPNAKDPVWDGEELKIMLPAGTQRPPRVLVRVWDDDNSKNDDPLASLEVQLEPLGGACTQLALKGRDGLPDILIDFEYKILECEAREDLLAEPVPADIA